MKFPIFVSICIWMQDLIFFLIYQVYINHDHFITSYCIVFRLGNIPSWSPEKSSSLRVWCNLL